MSDTILPAAEESLRVFVTPRLHSEPFDEIWHRTLDDALDYIHDNLVEWINCRFTEEEIVRDGISYNLIEARIVDAEDYAAIFCDNDEVRL